MRSSSKQGRRIRISRAPSTGGSSFDEPDRAREERRSLNIIGPDEVRIIALGHGAEARPQSRFSHGRHCRDDGGSPPRSAQRTAGSLSQGALSQQMGITLGGGEAASHRRADGRCVRHGSRGGAHRRRERDRGHGQRIAERLLRTQREDPQKRSDVRERRASARADRPDHRAVGAAHRRVLADGERAPAARTSRECRHPAYHARRPAPDHPCLRQAVSHAGRDGGGRFGGNGVGVLPHVARAPAQERGGVRRDRQRQDHDVECALVPHQSW